MWVICIDEGDYPVSLTDGGHYQVLATEGEGDDQLYRLIDDTGADYLFPASLFKDKKEEGP